MGQDDGLWYERRRLYDEVWARPLGEVAKDYGVSDVALGKACRRLGVPLPGRGHWLASDPSAKRRRHALPPLPPGRPDRIRVRGLAAWEHPRDAQIRAKVAAAAARLEARPAIQTADSLRGSHKALRGGLRLIQAAQRDGASSARGPAPEIVVARASRRRALLVLDALFRALEARGHRVEVSEEARQRDRYGAAATLERRTGVHVGADFVRLGVFEQERHLEGEPGAPPWQARKKEWSGILQLRLLGRIPISHMRTKWGDGKKSRLEDRLGDVVLGIERVALALAEERAREEAAARARAEAQRLEQERREAAARERARQEDAHKRIEALRRAADLRMLVEAVRLRGAATPERDAWTAWAVLEAERLERAAVDGVSLDGRGRADGAGRP